MFPFLGLNQRGNPAAHPSRGPASLSCGTARWRGAERLPVFQVWIIIAQGAVGEGQGMAPGAGWALRLSDGEGGVQALGTVFSGTRLDSL